MPDGRVVAAVAGPDGDRHDQLLGRAPIQRGGPKGGRRALPRPPPQTFGTRPSDADIRATTKLGETIASGGFEAIAGAGIESEPILMPYDNEPAAKSS